MNHNKIMKQNHIKTNSFQAWLLAARPKTLSGAAVPVMIGAALAWADSTPAHPFQVMPAVLCLLFAFAMQIDANLVNDLFDYLGGRDDRQTRLGPPRASTEGWTTPRAMRRAIILVTLVACALGLPLIAYGGLEMVLVGILCVAFCFLYTTCLAGMGLGDVLVLVFFGVVPVSLTYYLQHHTCTWTVFTASVACGLVIDGLLIVNNFRDRDTDRAVGKNTLVVRIGAEPSLAVYLSLGVVAWIMDAAVFIGSHPWATLLPIIYLALHIATWRKMRRIGSGRELNQCLAETARNMFVYGLTVSAGALIN